MSEIPSTVYSALSFILSPEADVGAPLSTALLALRIAIDQLNKKQDLLERNGTYEPYQMAHGDNYASFGQTLQQLPVPVGLQQANVRR
ncbi:unnamed protein product [Cylicocyclus nassatus]|uniref:Uncharacterized protein n=1 Tax=Cylicocyclus nassatus TaxID=53992 RepID=A0AA36GMR8_CYLNA|nr:unnamed protein product [Cylicocyclus nassatus]